MSMGEISSETILEKFADIVSKSLRIDAARVVEDAYLDDLGAESLDLLEITMEAEEAFNILIPQKNILQTAQEVLGAGVLISDGCVTEAGRFFLSRRIPAAFRRDLPEQPTVTELNRFFLRVQMWVWMIGGLIEHTPRTCSSCGAAFQKAVAGRLKCPTCASEYELLPGEEINRRWVQQYQEEFWRSSRRPRRR